MQCRDSEKCNVVKVNLERRAEVATSTSDNEGKSDRKRRGSKCLV
jgi:hypothetical protein